MVSLGVLATCIFTGLFVGFCAGAVTVLYFWVTDKEEMAKNRVESFFDRN